MWGENAVVATRDELTVEAKTEAAIFKKRYEDDVQFVFSHVQHHWHTKTKEGNDVPMKYCRPYGKHKVGACCKRGFPKHVFRMRNGQVDMQRVRPRVICPGVARNMKLRCSGRRNMLGAIVGRRRDAYFSGTAALKAHLFRSNTNLQVPYRLPITEHTHDTECKSTKCLSQRNVKKMTLATQRAQKAMSGYFGGYIGKRQKTGQFELKKSVEALPHLQEKLEARALPGASHQLAHVCNRVFTTLEGKGILRTGTEEFMLASGYKENDELAAEFVRTCRHTLFHGRFFMERFDALVSRKTEATLNVLLPRIGAAIAETDSVSLYGFRPKTPSMFFLSPWEFCQEFKAHRVRVPSSTYKLSKWIQKPEKGKKEIPKPGIDYCINLKYVQQNSDDVFLMPIASDLDLNEDSVERYDIFRNAWVLIRRSRPVVPCPENTPLPRRYDTKEKKATLLSVYLRPWTLIKKFATQEVLYLRDFKAPCCRVTWKDYLKRVLPASLRQIRNFMSATMAEGRIDADDEDRGQSEKLTGIRLEVLQGT
jgi:hypothetical protein